MSGRRHTALLPRYLRGARRTRLSPAHDPRRGAAEAGPLARRTGGYRPRQRGASGFGLAGSDAMTVAIADPGGRAARRPVLITGGAGFIGTNLADRLLRRGRRVRILDRDRKSTRLNSSHVEISYAV